MFWVKIRQILKEQEMRDFFIKFAIGLFIGLFTAGIVIASGFGLVVIL